MSAPIFLFFLLLLLPRTQAYSLHFVTVSLISPYPLKLVFSEYMWHLLGTTLRRYAKPYGPDHVTGDVLNHIANISAIDSTATRYRHRVRDPCMLQRTAQLMLWNLNPGFNLRNTNS